MAAGNVALGNLVTITHASGVAMAKILSWSHTLPDRVTVDTSDCSTTGPTSFLAAPDYDMGTVTVSLRFNSTLTLTTALSATTPTALTLTFVGDDALSTFVCDAWMVGCSSQGAKDQIIDATFNFKLNGTNITW